MSMKIEGSIVANSLKDKEKLRESLKDNFIFLPVEHDDVCGTIRISLNYGFHTGIDKVAAKLVSKIAPLADEGTIYLQQTDTLGDTWYLKLVFNGNGVHLYNGRVIYEDEEYLINQKLLSAKKDAEEALPF